MTIATVAPHPPHPPSPAAVGFALLQSWLSSSTTLQLPLHAIEARQSDKGREVSFDVTRLTYRHMGRDSASPTSTAKLCIGYWPDRGWHGRENEVVLDTEIQIVSNEAGEPTAVIIPIELWREIAAERETAYLLKSAAMKQRLLAAKQSQEGLSIEAVVEKLGI